MTGEVIQRLIWQPFEAVLTFLVIPDVQLGMYLSETLRGLLGESESHAFAVT